MLLVVSLSVSVQVPADDVAALEELRSELRSDTAVTQLHPFDGETVVQSVVVLTATHSDDGIALAWREASRTRPICRRSHECAEATPRRPPAIVAHVHGEDPGRALTPRRRLPTVGAQPRAPRRGQGVG